MRTGAAVLAGLLAASLASSCRREPGGDVPAGAAPASRPTSTAGRRVGPARVRAVDAVPDGRALELFASDAVAFPALQYKAVTAYQELPPVRTSFRLRPAGQDRAEPLASAESSLAAGEHYTLVAMPSREGRPAELKLLDDELQKSVAGRARVRVVNASPDAGSASVFVGGRSEAIAAAVGPVDAGGFREVAPVAGTLEVRRGKDGPVLARLPATRLEQGRVYTVFLLGRSAGTLEAMLVEDQRELSP